MILARKDTLPTLLNVRARVARSGARSVVTRTGQGIATYPALPLASTSAASILGKLNAAPNRSLFIQTQTTPNPRSLKFLPGKTVLKEGEPMSASFDLSNRVYAKKRAPLAYTLLLVDGVTNVMFGSDFISVTIAEGADWMHIKPHVFAAISDAFAEGSGPLLRDVPEEETKVASTTENIVHNEEDAEVVALIKQIIDDRIRPSVMEDGGDVEFVKFDENRIVWLKMMGSCSGCPSSGATLKQGIQNMLRYYVEEVAGVEEWVDAPLETVSADALAKLEQNLEAARTGASGNGNSNNNNDKN